MRSILRLAAVVAVALMVPVVPFLLAGPQLQEKIIRWLGQDRSDTWIGAAIVLLLGGDILLPIPSSLVSTLAGSRLGAAAGTFVCWLGMTLGAAAGFALARAGGPALVRRMSSSEDQRALSGAIATYGVATLVFTRALPVLAETTVLLVGAGGLAWRRFLPPVAACNLVIAATYAMLGSVATQREWLVWAVGASLALPIVAAEVARRWWKGRAGG